MLRALVVKELRESTGLIALGALGSVYVLSELTGVRILPWQQAEPDQTFPFVSDLLPFFLVLVGGGLAIVLGLKQSAWELWQGTYFFLLHRPTSRRRMFGTKLIVGSSLLLLMSGAPILVYALWAATPGTHATPFFWSMTASAWQTWLSLLLLYLGAFLSGIRPGKWYGTRFAPLVACIVVVSLAIVIPWWWLSAAIVAVAVAILVPAIFYYVEVRDY